MSETTDKTLVDQGRAYAQSVREGVGYAGMADHIDHMADRIEALEEKLRYALGKNRCACQFDDEGETPVEQCAYHAAQSAEKERLRVRYVSDLSRAVGRLEGLGFPDRYLTERLADMILAPPKEG